MPVVDEVAADYVDDVAFVAVAGRSGFDETAERAAEWFSDRIMWGLDDSVWELYGIFGQPSTVLVDANGTIVDEWFGARGDAELRTALDALIATGA